MRKGGKQREKKYQGIKLHHSGRATTERKAMTKLSSVALSPEYTSMKDLSELYALEKGISRIQMTRGDLKKVSTHFFKPNVSFYRRDDYLAAWLTGEGKKIDWSRDGNLIRRGKPNRPRIGSSRGKIGRTRVVGVKKTLHDFKMLIETLKRLQGTGKYKNTKSLQQAVKAVRTSVDSKTISK